MSIIHVVDFVHATLTQVLEIVRGGDPKFFPHGLVSTHTQLVEDVEASLPIIEGMNTRFLKQEVGNLSSQGLSTSRELDFYVLPLQNDDARSTE